MSLQLFSLEGKVALVTGAGANGGIGHAIALGFARAGADVVASDVDLDGALTTQREIEGLGRRCLAVRCDNSKREDIEVLFTTIDGAFGRLTILVNNVGAGARFRPEDLPFDDWQRVLSISLSSSFLCSQQAGRRMISQGTGGSIINISSIASLHALGRGNLPHSVAKSGVNQMTKELATEWGPHGIRVNAILPATVRTPSWKTITQTMDWDYDAWVAQLLTGLPLGRLGEPEDMVGPAIFLASDASAFVTGQLLGVDGGNLALDAGGSIAWPALRKDLQS